MLTSPKAFPVSQRQALHENRSLTSRSSGTPTACRASHQAQGLRPILRLLPGTPRCRGPLNSNVRQRRKRHAVPQQSQRLSAWAEQPRGGRAANSQQPAAATLTTIDRRVRMNMPHHVSLGFTRQPSARVSINSTVKNSKDIEKLCQLNAPHGWRGTGFKAIRAGAESRMPNRNRPSVAAASIRGAPRSAARSGKHPLRATRSNNALVCLAPALT